MQKAIALFLLLLATVMAPLNKQAFSITALLFPVAKTLKGRFH